jgi:DNA-binding NtrC family response regulator
MSGQVLIVDDEREMCEFVASGLGRRGFEPSWCLSADEALALLATRPFGAVLADLNMPGTTGIELCREIAARQPDVPVLVVTAFGSLDTAVAAIRAGAYDFITKPFEIDALALALDRAVKHGALREEVRRLRRAVKDARISGEILGESRAIRQVTELVDGLADAEATVLITGESGTGKELVARALHMRSRRSAGPFVAINCAAMAESLIESELFGHVKGAFTDARETRAGLFVQARKGTIFLDEIGEMPRPVQAKLLRALETRTARPVGSDVEVPFDTRVVAATNRDLDTEVEEGRFRNDLFFRINVLRVHVPPLRARGNDVLLLAQEFIERAAARAGKAVKGVSPRAAERLLAYPWPGNVRELVNAIEHAVALTVYEHIVPADLPERVREHRSSHVLVAGDDPSQLLSMEEVERRYILRVLEASGGNKTLAAKILGFDRRTMYRKLERFEEPRSRESPGRDDPDR